MPFTLEQLRAGITIEDAEDELLEFVQDQGIQTTDWKEGSPELTMLKCMAYVYTGLVNRASTIAGNTINTYSSGTYLSIFSDSHYDNQRVTGSVTIGTMIITGSAAVVPRTFAAAELKVTDGNYIFYNQDQFTISNASPYVSAVYIAEESGAEYNIAASSSLSFIGNFVGFSVTNPALSGSTTWITTLGADEESDDTLRQRNATKWATLQTGDLTIDRCRYLALSASTDLAYVNIDDTNPRGPFTVDVYLSEELVTASVAQVAAVQSAFDDAWFGNSTSERVTAYAASGTLFNRSITVLYRPAFSLTVISSSVVDACNNWVGSIPIGGNDYSPYGTNIASINDLIADLEDINGVEKVIVSSSSDYSLAINEKLLPPTNWASVITFTRLTS